jgi:hypothetical protein
MLRYSAYLLYWDKSTNTDASGLNLRCPVYLLYWYKSINTDAGVAQVGHMLALAAATANTEGNAAVSKQVEQQQIRQRSGALVKP